MKECFTVACIIAIVTANFGQDPKETATVRLNDIELYYEVYGSGEPLLLLHGWTQSSAFWADYIPAYAENHTVYALDLRGHGKTSPLKADFTIKKAAIDILALLDHLKLDRVKAIGLSY